MADVTAYPVIFSAPMVRAILDGRKTQTRRLAWGERKISTRYHDDPSDPTMPVPTPWHRRYEKFQAGERPWLWVKHPADIFPVYYRQIRGWEGLYAAGTDGKIYRVDRNEPRPLKPSFNTKGYPIVSLSRGKWHTKNVHRLVCEAFYGPAPFDGAQVRHIDGDFTNSTPANLDWGTQEENWQDRKAHGGGMGETHHAAKLTEAAVQVIKKSSASATILAKQFGVSDCAIHDIRAGRTWQNHEPAPRNNTKFSLWSSPLHMPRWASRLSLEVTDMRIERLQDISEEDARAEGVESLEFEREEHDWSICPKCGGTGLHNGFVDGGAVYDIDCTKCDTHKKRFGHLWNSIHGPDAWDQNPEIVAVSFEVHKANIGIIGNG